MACNTPKHASSTPPTSPQADSVDDDRSAIVYDPVEHDLWTERVKNLKNYENFEVDLPRWRYRVNIFVDGEHKSGFVASIHLRQLGISKNLKRWRQTNYDRLFVKGAKPWMP